MMSLNDHILSQACDFRSGLVLPYNDVATSPCDIPGYYFSAVAKDPAFTWQTASGGIGTTEAAARCVAIAEALERYAGAVATMPLQRINKLEGHSVLGYQDFALFSKCQHQMPDFPWALPSNEAGIFGEVYSMVDQSPVWVPQECINLGSSLSTIQRPSLSSGLAAHTCPHLAMLRATQELIERDAFSQTWIYSLPGRELVVPESYLALVSEKQGFIQAFDITQAWNPHPVIVVCGYLPKMGVKRYALGVACRENEPDAFHKAWQEWLQGVCFASYLSERDTQQDSELSDFEAHAVYYTRHPKQWLQVPMWKQRSTLRALAKGDPTLDSVQTRLRTLVDHLEREGVRLYYRNLTTPDVRESGLVVVRVLSPELSHLHGDESCPFLGSGRQDIHWRYPDIPRPKGPFPNIFPHPLG